MMEHIRGIGGLAIMFTMWPIYMPLLLIGAAWPRTRLGSMCARAGDKLLCGWPIDGETASDQYRAAGLPAPMDKLLWPGCLEEEAKPQLNDGGAGELEKLAG